MNISDLYQGLDSYPTSASSNPTVTVTWSKLGAQYMIHIAADLYGKRMVPFWYQCYTSTDNMGFILYFNVSGTQYNQSTPAVDIWHTHARVTY